MDVNQALGEEDPFATRSPREIQEGILITNTNDTRIHKFECSICFHKLKEIKLSASTKAQQLYHYILKTFDKSYDGKREAHHTILYMCPYSINSKQNLTHGMCIDCAVSLYLQKQKVIVTCPTCRKKTNVRKLKNICKYIPSLSFWDILPDLVVHFILHIPFQRLISIGIQKLFRSRNTSKKHKKIVIKRVHSIILGVLVLSSSILGFKVGYHVAVSNYRLFGINQTMQTLEIPPIIAFLLKQLFILITVLSYGLFPPYFLISSNIQAKEQLMKKFLVDGLEALTLDVSNLLIKKRYENDLHKNYSSFFEQHYHLKLARERPRNLLFYISLFCSIGRYIRVSSPTPLPSQLSLAESIFSLLGPGVILSTIHTLSQTISNI